MITATGGSGGYAERAVADAAGLVDVPGELSMADAVALLADGRTAVGLARAAELRAGETVLIEAVADGVGSLLVQLARNSGARVVAAAGGPRKVSLAGKAGADVAVDYTVPGWDGQVRTRAGPSTWSEVTSARPPSACSGTAAGSTPAAWPAGCSPRSPGSRQHAAASR